MLFTFGGTGYGPSFFEGLIYDRSFFTLLFWGVIVAHSM